MAVRLVLVAHAATAATRDARFPGDEPLDERGAHAAAKAGGSLRRVGAAYGGPEKRCGQTAAALGLDAVADPALRDLDLGTWRGRTLAELAADHPAGLRAWLSDPGAAPHGGESVAALVTRVAGWLNGLSGAATRVAAVTHPAIIRAAVLHALGAPAECFWRLDAAPLSQTWLTHDGARWQLRETGHPLTPS
jgi:broad specificity phosphatase PhoE